MKNKILNIDYKKFTLPNGLEVILYQDNSLPLVAVNIWYKVGSANENPDKTGFAHLFEHMMFQGSENVPKEMHFRYVQEAGGNLNGSTSLDRTNYYETVPSNYLEMALWLEADRMGFFLPALTQDKLDNQKDVVMNERRQRYDNQPYGLAWEILFANLYPENHPYHWPTIGWMKDIEEFELTDVKKFFQTYYSPNNASLVIAGNFENANVEHLVNKYFGEIKAFPEIPHVNKPEFTLSESKKIFHQDNVQLSRIYLAWKSNKYFGENDAALDILSDILSGSKNSRLYKLLVFDKQIAQDVSAFQYSAKRDGTFIIIATARPGTHPSTLKDEIINELDNLIVNGITENELQRSKTSIRSSFIYSLQNIENMANTINSYNFHLNEPNSFLVDLQRYFEVTEDDIIKTAKQFLKQNFVELHIIPKEK